MIELREESQSPLISVINLQKRVKVDRSYIQEVAKQAIMLGSKDKRKFFQGNCEAAIILVDNNYIRRLNKKYRKVNHVTDVIAFPMGEDEKFAPSVPFASCLLGDVFISAERARTQAKDFSHTVREEIAILTVHGILHLLGYDHLKTNGRLLMRKKEEEIFAKLGISKNEI